MKVGLFFGSFNPVHTGHLVIAEYLLEFSDLDEIWFVISPQNPLKAKDTLTSDEHRLNMLRLGVPEVNSKLRICEVELGMPRPSYTVDTLKELGKLHPGYTFVVLMGSDSVKTLHLWKDYETLINGWDICVYPREAAAQCMEFPSGRFTLVDAPVIGISSTRIRELVGKGLDVAGYVPDGVWEYILRNHLYDYRKRAARDEK